MPLPMPTNLPFQPLAGSQTSTLMSLSLLGVRVASTRQNSGRSRYAAFATPGGRLPGRPGCWNAPGATSVAAVTVPPGNAIWASSPHSAAATGADASAASAAPADANVFNACRPVIVSPLVFPDPPYPAFRQT